jgi:hypothetical protein
MANVRLQPRGLSTATGPRRLQAAVSVPDSFVDLMPPARARPVTLAQRRGPTTRRSAINHDVDAVPHGRFKGHGSIGAAATWRVPHWTSAPRFERASGIRVASFQLT